VLLRRLGYEGSHEIKHTILFVLLNELFESVIGLPWSLYSTFVVEERHGFNKQTYLLFFTDLMKQASVLVELEDGPSVSVLAAPAVLLCNFNLWMGAADGCGAGGGPTIAGESRRRPTTL
jgi:CAAX prenyl protease N-terminal, five membrane helices